MLCVSLIIAEIERRLGGQGLQSHVVDLALAIISIAVCAFYIHVALGPVYGTKGPWRVAKATLLAAAVGALFVGYRFAIFLITLYTA